MPTFQKGISAIYILISVIILTSAIAGAYYLGTKNQASPPVSSPSPTPTPQPTSTPTPTPQISPSPFPTPKADLIENIKASVISKNYAALEGYSENQVNLIIEATECCGIVDKAKAIKELNYLNSATFPWNFDQTDPIIVEIKQKYPQIFSKDSLIGIAANDFMVAFTLNSNMDKIAKIYLAATYKLLNNK
ncbi:MAG: hypothetical protein Q8P92_02870 [Candidatus Daviesbacteria bacterium]|nr:hypothetical protein [Candidatus Daviesbacteria bacterium]